MKGDVATDGSVKVPIPKEHTADAHLFDTEGAPKLKLASEVTERDFKVKKGPVKKCSSA